jgi:hypothetical protein
VTPRQQKFILKVMVVKAGWCELRMWAAVRVSFYANASAAIIAYGFGPMLAPQWLSKL